MLKKVALMATGCLMSINVFANTLVEMKTSMGNIEIELFNDQAPI